LDVGHGDLLPHGSPLRRRIPAELHDVLSRLPALTSWKTADLMLRRWLTARNRAHAA